MNKTMRNQGLLLITAIIWGIAFVAQSEGGDAVGPYSFNSVRSLIGSAVLIPVILLFDKIGKSGKKPETRSEKRQLWIGGTVCGTILFFASNLQQIGLYMGTTAGKAGFLTACYIIFVPVIGIFFKKKCGLNVWISVVLTLIGLYLLCINETFRFQKGDALIILCAFLFSGHIMVVDYFSPKVDGVRMSCIQFFVCGVLSAIPMCIFEMGHNFDGISEWAQAFQSSEAWIAILYAGVCSCGIAYTLQIIGQDGVNPTIASLILSLEAVFSVLAGWIILHETLTTRELIGCGIIFVAVILTQIKAENQKSQD